MAARTVDRYVESNPTIILGDTNQKVEVLEYLRRNTPDGLPELKSLQQKEFSKSPKYNRAWNEAIKIYNTNNNPSFPSIYNSSQPVEYHIALIAYTLNEPNFYVDFNSATRNLESASDFDFYPFKSFFKLLLLATINVSGKPTTIPSGQKLYRGVTGRIDNAEVGNTVVFQHFVSTSRIEGVTDTFFQKPSNGAKILFVLENIQSDKMYTCLDEHSPYDEQEVLVCPYENYLIEKIEVKNKKRYIYLKAKTFDDGNWCVIS